MGIHKLTGVLVWMLLAAPAASQSIQDIIPGYRAQGPAPRLKLFGDTACPIGADGEVVVCSRPITAEGIRALHDFGKCLAGRRKDEARQLLVAAVDAAEYRRLLEALINDHAGCAPNGSLGFSAILLVGGIAEALFERGATAAALAELLRHDPSKPSLEARDESEFIGLCAARIASKSVVELLATRPTSIEERSALRAVAQHLPSCVPSGSEIKLNPAALRAALAIGAFRIAAHNAS